jgi:thioredoxin reductase
MSSQLNTAIIGAGPYGLSLAAHLRAANVDFRIFGNPMLAWQTHMPPNMFLKSDVYSSDLSDPKGLFTIKRFYEERGLHFGTDRPIPLDTFIEYGRQFQSRCVPNVENQEVVSVEPDGNGYIVTLASQEKVRAKRVVVAVGVYPFRFIPQTFASLPLELCTHSGDYGPVDGLRGKKVAVIGSGASAIDTAISIHEAGADVTVISRRASINFQGPPPTKRPSLVRRLRSPDSGIGAGWKTRFYADAPGVVHSFPAALRARILRTTLGPAPGWFTKDKIVGHVPVLSGRTTQSAVATKDGVKLVLEGANKTTRTFEADHIVAATGYKTDVEKLPLLSESIRRRIRTYDGTPVLSRAFESSSPDVYFIGPATAMSFGPVMRFVFGCTYTIDVLAKHLCGTAAQRVS